MIAAAYYDQPWTDALLVVLCLISIAVVLWKAYTTPIREDIERHRKVHPSAHPTKEIPTHDDDR